MTKEKLLETILKTSYSKVEIYRRIRLWRSFLESEFFGKGKKSSLSEFLKKEAADPEDAKVMDDWGDGFFDTFTKDNAYEITDALTEAIKNLPLVNLYVPFEPGQKDIEAYGVWFRANVDQYMILEVHLDASVFGGCAFSIDGRYYDYSLRHRLETKTNQIHDILGRFLVE